MAKRDDNIGLGGLLGRLTFRLLRSDAGSVSLEFVIMLPFLIMILVGIIDGSLMLYDKAAIANAARAGARAGTVLKVPPLTTGQIAAITTASAQGSLVTGGNASLPTVTVTQANGTSSGSPLQVTVSYTYQGLMLGSALSALTGPIVLNATAVMNYE
jgi:Flp pilus assembly protein TadG